MKILYSLPHPSDQLDVERAGHVIRANALLGALERQGHTVVRVEASRAVSGSTAAVNTYRGLIKRHIPRAVALRVRDVGRLLYARAFARRLEEAVVAHRPDVIFETNIAFSSAGARASASTGVPLVLDDVAPPLEEDGEVGYGVGLKQAAVDVFGRITRQAAVVVAVSDPIRDYLLQHGVDPSRIETIPNGIEGGRFNAGADGAAVRSRLRLPAEAIVLVFVGSFQPFHRVDLLLDAVAALQTSRPLHVLLIGEGATTAAAREQAARLGLTDRVHFVGRVPYAEVAAHAAAGDIAVLPGVLDFGNSMKLFEYMALGKAVVAPDLAVVRAVARDREQVILFADGDRAALQAALQTLMEDAGLRQRLGRAAAAMAGEHTWDARAGALVTALHRRGIGVG